MKKIKPIVVSLIGARPQFIKIAPLAKNMPDSIEHIIIHSGQHYDYAMSEIFFKQLNIPEVKYNLSVGSGSHAEMTSSIMKRFEKRLLDIRPNMVLVYGDTNSTLAGALTASKLNIPVGHVEAGLRSYEMNMPEEINRRLTDHLAAFLFCPTPQSIKNLKAEGIKKGIINCGDLMYELIEDSQTTINNNGKILEKYELTSGEYILFTMHRAGTVDNKYNLKRVLTILESIDSKILFPIHPRTEKNFRKFGLIKRLKTIKNLHLCHPVSYLDNLTLIANAWVVMTDSGGIQKEAVFLNRPCLTLRDETEWTETVGKGNYLVGLSKAKIMTVLKSSLKPKKRFKMLVKKEQPSITIINTLEKYLFSKRK